MKKFLVPLLLLLLIPIFFAMEPQAIESMRAELVFDREMLSDFPVTEATFLTYELPADTVGEPGGYVKKVDDYGSTYLEMNWEDTDDLSYSFVLDIETSPSELVKSSPKFPKNYVGFDDYLASGDYTPVTPAIRKKANEIVHGSGTTFEAAARLALWANQNIDYEISYGNRIETSVQTFEKMEGTCDEFSHLFIAMARSVGIPARYVSGITYGTFGIEGGGSADWYSHGWAEAYVGEWVSFDPTYGEIGYIDGTHIKIAHAPDQKGLESYLTWRPDTSMVDIGELGHSVTVIGTTNFSRPLQRISLELIPNEAAFGEFVLARITSVPRGCSGQGLKLVYSDRNTQTPDISIAVGESFMTSIACGEETVNYAVLKIPDTLEGGYTYQYEILVYNNQDEDREKLTVNPKLAGENSAELSLGKVSLEPGEAVEVKGTVALSEPGTIYLFNDGELAAAEEVQAGGSELTWALTDGEPGLHELHLYAARALAEARYSVEAGGPLELEIVGPDTIEPGNRTHFEVKIDGDLYTAATVTFDLFTAQTQVVTLTGAGAETITFAVDIPETELNTIYATAQVVSPGASAQAVKEISVYHRPVPKSEQAAESISGFFSRLIENLRYLFRQILKKV